MADITKHGQYMEGKWTAERLLPRISSTTYETLEGAIATKTELIRNFEEKFGFSREMEEPHSDYAYNLGMLDVFNKAEENGIPEEGGLEDSEES
jgi:hypothetical protein